MLEIGALVITSGGLLNAGFIVARITLVVLGASLLTLTTSPVEIAERMGHEGISVTYTYSHLYPSKQKSMADKLNEDRQG